MTIFKLDRSLKLSKIRGVNAIRMKHWALILEKCSQITRQPSVEMQIGSRMAEMLANVKHERAGLLGEHNRCHVVKAFVSVNEQNHSTVTGTFPDIF